MSTEGVWEFRFSLSTRYFTRQVRLLRGPRQAPAHGLAEAYGRYKGTQFDKNAFFAAFAPTTPRTDPHIAVIGAKMGTHLFSLVEETMPLPVENLTCASNRSVVAPEDQAEFAALMEAYARQLLGQLPCMRMTDNTARKQLFHAPGLEGVVYHTLQFCDYYGFEYAGLRDLRPGLQPVPHGVQLCGGGPGAGHFFRLPDGDLAVGLQDVDQGRVIVADPAGGFVEHTDARSGRGGRRRPLLPASSRRRPASMGSAAASSVGLMWPPTPRESLSCSRVSVCFFSRRRRK